VPDPLKTGSDVDSFSIQRRNSTGIVLSAGGRFLEQFPSRLNLSSVCLEHVRLPDFPDQSPNTRSPVSGLFESVDYSSFFPLTDPF